MYRVSPATYLAGGIISTSMANANASCSATELLRMQPPEGMNCGTFLNPYLEQAGGQVLGSDETDLCTYCPISNTNQFLSQFEVKYSNRWRDYGLLWAYVLFNIVTALALYWLFRVPKGSSVKQAKRP